MNNVTLVGRIVKDLKIEEKENKKMVLVTLGVTRQHKNAEGVYETDFIECIFWNVLAESALTYFKVGDLLGVKGRLENYEDTMFVIADKVTFLTMANKSEEE